MEVILIYLACLTLRLDTVGAPDSLYVGVSEDTTYWVQVPEMQVELITGSAYLDCRVTDLPDNYVCRTIRLGDCQ